MNGYEHIRKKMNSHEIKTGHIKDIFQNTDIAFVDWATERTHKLRYETVSEMMRDILLDLYYEETQQ